MKPNELTSGSYNKRIQMQTAKRVFRIALMIVWVVSGLAFCPAFTESRETSSMGYGAEGLVDRDKGMIYGIATGRVDMSAVANKIDAEESAYKKAVFNARQALRKAVHGVSNGNYFVDQLIGEDAARKEEVEAIIRHAKKCENLLSWIDGMPAAKVKLGVALKDVHNWVYKYPTPPPPPPHYTGLILDARKLGGQPLRVPRIFSSDHETLVRGLQNADYQRYIKIGLVDYTDTVEKARRNPRVGNNPLVITVENVQEPDGGDYVVSNDDAMHIKEADSKSSIFKKCKTVIVLQ